MLIWESKRPLRVSLMLLGLTWDCLIPFTFACCNLLKKMMRLLRDGHQPTLRLPSCFLALESFAFGFLTEWGSYTAPSLAPPSISFLPMGLLSGDALVTHCFHRGAARCSHIILLRCPARRSCWDSPPPHRGLQQLLLKRKTQKHTI